jgi:ATP-dependent exoDNAse (exonuclease V) beta subunit
MERWDLADPSWLREAGGPIARREAADRFLAPGPVEREVSRILDEFLAGPLPARLREMDLIGREVPVLHPDGGVLMQGVADLLYREAGGGVVVADHKTDLVTAAGIPALASRYAPQLRAYAGALRAALPPGTPVRAELWLARTGTIVPVDA